MLEGVGVGGFWGTPLALLMHQPISWVDNKGESGKEFWVSNVRETCHATESKSH